MDKTLKETQQCARARDEPNAMSMSIITAADQNRVTGYVTRTYTINRFVVVFPSLFLTRFCRPNACRLDIFGQCSGKAASDSIVTMQLEASDAVNF